MSVFTDAELSYLAGQRLGRLATVGQDGRPHVVPVAYRYNADHDSIDIGGPDFSTRKKFRDVLKNSRVAFVVDDIPSMDPRHVRGLELRGDAEVLESGGTQLGPGYAPEMFRITPRRVVTWGFTDAAN